MREAQAMNFKDFDAIQTGLLSFFLSSDCMQQASKIIVQNFPIKMSMYLFSDNTQLITRKMNYSATLHLALLSATN